MSDPSMPPASGPGAVGSSTVEAKSSGSALGIVALVMACLFFVPLLPLVGLVLGIIALVRTLPGRSRTVPIIAISVGAGSFLLLQSCTAAIAIPAFIKYTRRAKMVEAKLQVRLIANDLRMYVEAERTDGNGKLLPRAFPPAVDWTPSGTACSRPSHRFTDDGIVWQASPWKEINFAIDGPHFYQYRIVREGQDAIVEARGDLDCNGTFSLFRRRVTADGQVMPEETEHETE